MKECFKQYIQNQCCFHSKFLKKFIPWTVPLRLQVRLERTNNCFPSVADSIVPLHIQQYKNGQKAALA